MPKFLTTHWGTYEVVEGKNSKIALKPWAEDQYSNSHYKYLEPMTLVGVFFLIVSIPSAILAMKLEKKFKQRKI